MPPIAIAERLRIDVPGAANRVALVDGVSYQVAGGGSLGMVGESGAGKSLSVLALSRLVPRAARLVARQLELAGVNVLAAGERELEAARGAVVGYLFQEPQQALNPLHPVWFQVCEAARLRRGLNRGQGVALAERLLEEVGLEPPGPLARAYPHELSGGQRQRVLLAAALAADPPLLIADEPTSALDALAQARFVDLALRLRATRGLALVFVSHDLGLIGAVADRVVVVYAGETVEEADRAELFAAPLHPYTRALVAAASAAMRAPFVSVPGSPPRVGEWGNGCRFVARCPHAMPRCHRARPAMAEMGGRQVRCFLHSTACEGDG